MGKNYSFFQNDVADLKRPDGKSVFEPKLAQEVRGAQIELATATVLVTLALTT